MIASGLMPRSLVGFVKFHPQYPVLQGSRRRACGPSVRFVFPLGERLNTTLALGRVKNFFRKFSRPSRGPRWRPALQGSALRGGEFGIIIRAPKRRRGGKPARTKGW